MIGEDIAKLYFERIGFTLLERRFLSPYGEIDLIFKSNLNNKSFKSDVEHCNPGLLFVEVKSRKSNRYTSFADIITKKQYSRINNSINNFMLNYDICGKNNLSIRFDVIVILFPEVEVKHFENVSLDQS